jgi:hypothetical protein
VIYEKTYWQHKSPDLPSIFFSELDDERWEIRKVEIFADGTMLYADDSTPYDASIGLSEFQVPEGPIASAPELATETIDAQTFERVWQAARSGAMWKF